MQAASGPHGPHLWRCQMEGLLSSNALGTVQEFHNFLCTLAKQQSGDCEFASLCAAILSAQTRDRVAIRATRQLATCFGSAEGVGGLNPAALALAPPELVSQCLQNVNFYKGKSLRLREIAATLLTQHSGRVPRDFKALVALPGVGPKIANLVLSVTFQEAGCGMIVDTHVHRVAQRLGWSTCSEPEQTRQRLEGFIPAEIREVVARRLIGFGQEICKPRHPRCGECPLAKEQLCPSAPCGKIASPGPEPRTPWKLRPAGAGRKRTLIDLSAG